ncbi:transcriptional regulator [Mycobacterium sp. E3298]|nr:transcriptional regulator [Mycobacterium sp. E3298]
MQVVNRLRDIRFESKMAQNDFASFLGVNKTLYNKWENQRSQPSLEWALRIAARTSRPTDEIFILVEEESCQSE